MEIITIVFTAMELGFAILFFIPAWEAIQLSRAGHKTFRSASNKVRNQAILGGALVATHLFIAFSLIRPFLDFLPDTRWILLGLWPINSAVSLWAYWKIR